jgi:hypothetical protein
VKIYRSVAALPMIFAGIFSVHAQPVNVQQFQSSQQAQQLQAPLVNPTTISTNAPELYPGENLDVGPQKILRLNPRPNYFDVLFDSQVFYSDNANFAQGADIIGSWIFVNTAQAAFTPPEFNLGPGKFAPAVGYISQWYNYQNNQMHSLDFNAQTAFISTRYMWGNWQFSLGGNYTRLLNQSDYEQTYQEFLPALVVQRFFPIGDKFFFVLGNEVDYHFTSVPETPGSSTEINNRFDEAIDVTLAWQLTRHFTLQPYYRFQYSNYRYDTLQTSDRNDYLNSLGVTLVYSINKNLSLRTFFNYNIKRSDDAFTPAYHEYNGGLGGTLDIAF